MSLEITEELIARQPPEAQAIIRLLLAKIAELEARLNHTPQNWSLPPSALHPHAKRAPKTPAVLKTLMRHASIDTTMAFYVEHNADDVSADLAAFAGSDAGVTLGVTGPKSSPASESTKVGTHCPA
jgi:hypothetical protein